MGPMQHFLHRARRWRYLDLGLVALLSMSVTICDVVWRAMETRPPHWDMGRHLWQGMNYLGLAQGQLWYDFATQYMYYPPLVYWTSLPFIWHHPSATAAVATNGIYIAILAGATYGIGKELWGRGTGLLASVFVLTTPMVISQFKEFQLDAPTLAMATLGLYLLIRSDFFGRLWPSVGFGAVVGLGMLTKWTYLFPLALPILYAVGGALYLAYRDRGVRRLAHLLYAGALAYMIALPWYVVNFYRLRIDLLQNGVGAGIQEHDPVVGSFNSTIWYIQNLSANQIDGWQVLALVLGLAAMAFRPANLRRNLFPLLTLVSTLLIFTLLRNKDARYTMPMLSSIAVIASYWILQIPWKNLRFSVAGFSVAYGVYLFVLISFVGASAPPGISGSIGWLPLRLLVPNGYIIAAPSHEQWYQEDIARLVFTREPDAAERKLALISPETIWFNGWGSLYYESVYRVSPVPVARAKYVMERKLSPAQPTQTHGNTIFQRQLPDGGTLVLTQKIP